MPRAEHDRIVAEKDAEIAAARDKALDDAAVYCNAVSLRGNDMERTKYRLAAGLPMTIDELKKLLSETTPGPWEPILDVFWRVYVADGGDYAGQCVGDMNESAAMWRSPSDEQPDDFAEANARLIAMAPDLAAEVIALREREARLVEALREAREAAHSVAHSEYDGVWNETDFSNFTPLADAALAEIEKEAGE